MGYEIKPVVDVAESKRKAKEAGITDYSQIGNEKGIFSSFVVTIKGHSSSYLSSAVGAVFRKVGIVQHGGGMGQDYINEIGWERLGTEKIPGLRCPYCNAQAYRTDFDHVAVCGASPGWYFFYTDIRAEDDSGVKNKIVMKYVDGVLQPVIVQGNGVEVGEHKT